MLPDLLSAASLSALFAIVLIDLVLAGDNALIIGLVARNLPRPVQRRVILWGTVGAIAVRALMAMLVVYLLALPGFMVAGGVALVWIARKLLSPEPPHDAAQAAGQAPAASFGAALRTIVVADAVMGIDNVLAIGGVAAGNVVLIVLGLAISVPIIVWGSHLVIRLVERFSWIILLGGVVLAWTGYGMIVREPLVAPWLAAHAPLRFVVALLVFAVALAPWYGARLPAALKPITLLLPALLAWLLAFETAASLLALRVDYLSASGTRGQLIELARWLGWLPPAAGLLWLRERLAGRYGSTSSLPASRR